MAFEGGYRDGASQRGLLNAGELPTAVSTLATVFVIAILTTSGGIGHTSVPTVRSPAVVMAQNLAGFSSSDGCTSKAAANRTNSRSVTHRTWDSTLASVSRLMSQPDN
jgi:hypothetical protein